MGLNAEFPSWTRHRIIAEEQMESVRPRPPHDADRPTVPELFETQVLLKPGEDDARAKVGDAAWNMMSETEQHDAVEHEYEEAKRAAQAGVDSATSALLAEVQGHLQPEDGDGRMLTVEGIQSIAKAVGPAAREAIWRRRDAAKSEEELAAVAKEFADLEVQVGSIRAAEASLHQAKMVLDGQIDVTKEARPEVPREIEEPDDPDAPKISVVPRQPFGVPQADNDGHWCAALHRRNDAECYKCRQRRDANAAVAEAVEHDGDEERIAHLREIADSFGVSSPRHGGEGSAAPEWYDVGEAMENTLQLCTVCSLAWHRECLPAGHPVPDTNLGRVEWRCPECAPAIPSPPRNEDRPIAPPKEEMTRVSELFHILPPPEKFERIEEFRARYRARFGELYCLDYAYNGSCRNRVVKGAFYGEKCVNEYGELRTHGCLRCEKVHEMRNFGVCPDAVR